MSCNELRQYLAPKFQEEGIKDTLLDDLEENEISGSVFLTLKEDDLRELLPNASFGARRKLIMIIKELSESPLPPTESEGRVYLRKFDTPVDHMDKYHLGRCCDTSSCVTDKTTQPLRLFNIIETDDNREESLEFIGSAVVKFASACINERRNGTVYFGVSPDGSRNLKVGEIVGVDIPREEVEEIIRRYLGKCFEQAQRSVVKNTVRDPKFVPVIDSSKSGKRLWVVEVDICPSQNILGDDRIITLNKLAGLPKSPKHGLYGFSVDGVPKLLSSDETLQFEKDHSRIVSQRRREEEEKSFIPRVDLRAKLLGLLTGGCDVMQDNVYPFLMLSPLTDDMNQNYLSENMPFVKALKPELVLDFDPKGSTDGVYFNLDEKQEESMQVLVTDNFDRKLNEKKDIESLKENLAELSRTAWMFCNGYQAMCLEPATRYDWKKSRKEGFMNALQFFIENYGADRIILIVCLFSDNYDIMLDACDEVLSKLQSGWIVLAESEDIARRWKEKLLDNCTVDQSELRERCVVGMTWLEVNSTLCQAAQVTPPQTCLLPTSNGARVEVREKKLKDWCDLELLTATDLEVDIDKSNQIRKDVEQQFYKGEQADWLNFWFEDQVLKRDIHYPLRQRVEEALKGHHKEEENMVSVVPILHQPMSGGTTSARQILWELRTRYRCCILLNISEDTIDQLEGLRKYKDPSPLPLLILIDNEDDEKYIQLRGRLEEKGRKLWRGSDLEEPCHVYCTIVLCIRRPSLPKEIKKDQIVLRQELTKRELEWFQHKSEKLTQVYTKDNRSNVNPKFLISFNILKENFNKDYITRVVKEFTEDVKSNSEIELLKFVSFLNTYDPYFKSVRVSALDKFIVNTGGASVASEVGRRKLQWEAQLSQSVKVLLNLSTNREIHRKSRTFIRVFNKIIAEYILNNMKKRCDQTDSEIMRQILISGLFQNRFGELQDTKSMKILINNIVKKREMEPDGKKRYRFSKFVRQVEEVEGADVAVEILEYVFEENEDAFTAQLISRYYIKLKNWLKAEKFAIRATELLPGNSYLWDTLGQVFREQLLGNLDKGNPGDGPIDIHNFLEISQKCVEVFQKEQEVSEREITYSGEDNLAGFFGELRVTALIMKALAQMPCFGDASNFQKFLIDKSTDVCMAVPLKGEEIYFLKDQFISAKKAMRKLDDEFLQIKDTSNYDVTLPVRDNNRSELIKIKIDLDQYLEAPGNQVPRNMPVELQHEYRSELIRKCGGNSLNQLLILRSKDEEKEINRVFHLVSENMRQPPFSLEDIRTFLDVSTVLLADGRAPKSLTFNYLLDLSRQLYSKPQVDGYQYLEPYLYFIMYNFPTEERQRERLCPMVDLKKAIEKWFEAFQQKYQKYNREDLALRRKVKTIFFLANGPPLFDIVHQDMLDEKMKEASRQDKWQLPEVKEKLRLMRGLLLTHGDKVRLRVTNAAGNSFQIDIATSYHVKKKEMWQKQVYFYLGFSFSGPKAFGMSLEP